MDYYIKDGDNTDGPYDMMAIIRKVRNGSVTEQTPLAGSVFEEPKPAGTYQEFTDFFKEERAQPHQGAYNPGQATHQHAHRPARSLMSLLSFGVDFLRNNIFAAIYSCLFMVAWVLIARVFMYHGQLAMTLIGVGLSYFLMGGYLFGILRFVRGNPVTFGLVLAKMVSSALNMGLAALVVAFVMLPPVLLTYVMGDALLVVTLPLLFLWLLIVLTFLAFAPLLITQRDMDFWDAIRQSARVVMLNKGQNLGNVFGLMALNFILCLGMPVVFPVTMGALVDLYDEHLG
jgi:hypothetical protein